MAKAAWQKLFTILLSDFQNEAAQVMYKMRSINLTYFRNGIIIVDLSMMPPFIPYCETVHHVITHLQ